MEMENVFKKKKNSRETLEKVQMFSAQKALTFTNQFVTALLVLSELTKLWEMSRENMTCLLCVVNIRQHLQSFFSFRCLWEPNRRDTVGYMFATGSL